MEELTRKEFREKQQQQLVGQGAIAEALQYVKYKIAILSGKGGVGKTATTVNLAAASFTTRSQSSALRTSAAT